MIEFALIALRPSCWNDSQNGINIMLQSYMDNAHKCAKKQWNPIQLLQYMFKDYEKISIQQMKLLGIIWWLLWILWADWHCQPPIARLC